MNADTETGTRDSIFTVFLSSRSLLFSSAAAAAAAPLLSDMASAALLSAAFFSQEALSASDRLLYFSGIRLVNSASFTSSAWAAFKLCFATYSARNASLLVLLRT
jgi:hypothetical protein